MPVRVAVIGAGPSGLSVLLAFEKAGRESDQNVELVAFEKQADFGGMWNLNWQTDTDGNGERVHGSMYRHLYTNGPKEIREYADYSFEEHFGQPIGSFPPREVMYDYITGRAKKWGVQKYIRLNTPVQHVSYSEKTEKFSVQAIDYSEEFYRRYEEEFDYVFVCTGHFSVPNMPSFEGIEQFEGTITHSHNLRNASAYQGRRVLIVGSSFSAEDLTMMLVKYGCEHVSVTHRGPMNAGFGDEPKVHRRPWIGSFTKDGVVFEDGSSDSFDDVLLCTGYRHHFPFMHEDLRLYCPNLLTVRQLYKSIFWQTNPKCMYIGMTDQLYTINLIDVQATYARDVVLGRLALPDFADRLNDAEVWWSKLRDVTDVASDSDRLKFFRVAAEYQTAYMRDLHAHTDYPAIDYDAVWPMVERWVQQKLLNAFEYRDLAGFKSYVTGNVSPPNKTKWMQQKDFTVESYLNDTQQ